LRIRPKNTPIPEECLTCDKMVDCMLHWPRFHSPYTLRFLYVGTSKH
jgi:hypothetical protein